MIKSKEWNWFMVSDDENGYWKIPSIESFYLVNRWKNLNKKVFLDLGCGLGRHSILFSNNGFDTYAFDLSENAIERSKEWAERMNLKVDFKIGDMLKLPYEDNIFDCILCRNVISHTDTKGIQKIISEIKRVLKKDGECYLTLCSKSSWGVEQENWPSIDDNTKIRMEEGPENGVPHFYADYDLIQNLFNAFKIEFINHQEDFYEKENKIINSYHYHLLVRKLSD